MKRVIVVVAAVAVLGLAAWRGVTFWLDRDGRDGLVLYGNVDIREVDLGFRVGGRLASLAVDEGDRVAPGDLLATLDDAPLRDALAAADATAQQAQAVLDRLLAGSRPQEIQQARAGVSGAEAALVNAEQTMTRQQDLVERGVSNQSLLDDALAAYDQAKARLAAARETLALAEEGPRSEDITAARAARAAAAAERARAQTALDDTRLQAPAAGSISVRVREVGAVLAAGQPVYTLTLDSQVYVRAYVDEPDLGRLAPGAEVRIETDAAGRPYRGHIGFVSPRAEFTPRTVETPQLRTDLVYRLRIIVDDADENLRQGMPVTVHVLQPEA